MAAASTFIWRDLERRGERKLFVELFSLAFGDERRLTDSDKRVLCSPGAVLLLQLVQLPYGKVLMITFRYNSTEWENEWFVIR